MGNTKIPIHPRPKPRPRLRYLLVVATLLSAPGVAVAGELVVVTNANPTRQITRHRLTKVLLGKTKKWSDGNKIVLAVLTRGPTHDAFIKRYARKTPKQFTNYWRKMVFSGKGKMPKSFSNEEKLMAFITITPGAIGYIDSATPRKGVKVLPVK